MTPSTSTIPNSTISALSALASSSSSSSSSSTSSPCAACKFLRRKCQPECVFAPYFPPDNPQKFIHVHRVFGASNVTKILNELPTSQREDAVNSLAYEADMRLKDPVYGCVGVISILQQQLRELQMHLQAAKAELAKLQSHHPSSFGINHVPIGINHNHNHVGVGFGFGRESTQHFLAMGRDSGNIHYPYQHHQHVLLRNCEGEVGGARMGVNGGGGYDNGMVTAVGGSGTGLGMLGLQFLKPSANGGEERPTIGP